MASMSNYRDDEENNEGDLPSNGGWNNSGQSNSVALAPAGGGTVSPGATAGSGGGLQPSRPASSGASQASAPSNYSTQSNQGGSGFVNIGNLLKMNQDAGNQLGDSIAGDARSKASKAQSDANQVFNSFQGSVNSSSPGAVDWSQFYDGSTPRDSGHLSQDVNQLSGIASRTYSGPTDITQSDGWSQAAQEAQDAQTGINALGQPGGAASELSKRGDDAAQSSFDQMFLGGNPAFNKLQSDYNAPGGNAFNNLSQLMGYYADQGQQAVNAKQLQITGDAAKANQLQAYYQGLEHQQGNNGGGHGPNDNPTFIPHPKAPPFGYNNPYAANPATGTPTHRTPDDNPVYPGITGLLAKKGRR